MYNLNKDKEFMMVKKIGIALLCMALGSTLYARDDISTSTTFVGLEVGYSEVQGSVGHYDIVDGHDIGVITPNFTGDYDIEYGLRIGAEKEQWRTTFIFDYYNSSKNDQNIEQGYLTLDYYILEKESAFRPYIGINVGYGNYESTFVEDSGFLYGGQAGVVLEVAGKMNFDLGYRYSLSDAEAFDHIGSFIFGFNYLLN
jgi:opacity protein-like surface antigen